MARDPAWQADLQRYPKRPWLKEQSIWAIAVYRFGRRIDKRKNGPVRWFLDRIYWLVYRCVETATGISFVKSVEIGPGLNMAFREYFYPFGREDRRELHFTAGSDNRQSKRRWTGSSDRR